MLGCVFALIRRKTPTQIDICIAEKKVTNTAAINIRMTTEVRAKICRAAGDIAKNATNIVKKKITRYYIRMPSRHSSIVIAT